MNLLRRFFRITPIVLTPSTRHKWPVDSTLVNRRLEKRAVLVREGRNVDRGPIDYRDLGVIE